MTQQIQSNAGQTQQVAQQPVVQTTQPITDQVQQGEVEKIFIWKKSWFWLVIAVVVIGIGVGIYFLFS